MNQSTFSRLCERAVETAIVFVVAALVVGVLFCNL